MFLMQVKHPQFEVGHPNTRSKTDNKKKGIKSWCMNGDEVTYHILTEA